jgi:hypothetical protein
LLFWPAPPFKLSLVLRVHGCQLPLDVRPAPYLPGSAPDCMSTVCSCKTSYVSASSTASSKSSSSRCSMRICALMPSSKAELVLLGTWIVLSCEMLSWIWWSCVLIAALMSTTSAGSCPCAGAYILACVCPPYTGRGKWCMMRLLGQVG